VLQLQQQQLLLTLHSVILLLLQHLTYTNGGKTLHTMLSWYLPLIVILAV
jgi:hypothetical protein